MKDSLLQSLEQLQSELETSLAQATDEISLQEIKSNFIGKKGRLTEVLKAMGGLTASERPVVGAKANEVKNYIDEQIRKAIEEVKNKAIVAGLAKDLCDITLPGRPEIRGHIHPINQVLKMACDIFEHLGFSVHTGPEIEDDYHNFEALNIPTDHPARDLQDTFYLKNQKHLLRTHTSTVQIRVMEKQRPPIRMIAPGAVYRCDSDVTHTPMFHQIEGLWIDQETTFADLKGVLTLFVQRMFGNEIQVRFRPSFFPFTEPSAELDMTCIFCKSQGCSICKGTGWIEVLGCGMVDPAVFQFVKYSPEKYTGFAFGIGIERIAMLKFGINDLRLFFENDVRFLNQF